MTISIGHFTVRESLRILRDFYKRTNPMKILRASGIPGIRETATGALARNHTVELRRLGHKVDCRFYGDVIERRRWPARFSDLEFAYPVSQRIRRKPLEYEW